MKHFSFRYCVIAFVLAATGMMTPGCGKTSAMLSSITVVPANPVAMTGSVVQFSAVAMFTDGMTILPWMTVNWTSSDDTIATVASNGVVTALRPGSVTITATDIGHPDIAGQAVLTVTNMPLVSLVVTAAAPVLAPKATTQVTAEGVFADGSRYEVTSSVVWTSSNAAAATVSNTQGQNGLVTAVGAGTATITAVDLQTGTTASTVIIVSP